MHLRFLIILLISPLVNFNVNAEELADSISPQSLNEIVVTGQSARQRIEGSQLGRENLELYKLSLTPQLFGETDIIKSMTLLPGVRSETDGAGGFEVRGGNAYQNLVIMDGMTLYNPSHVMGLFSTFNDDAIGNATLYKGPIPAKFGNASSSILEVNQKNGDMENHHFSATIGILNAKASVNGPIIKDKLSFSLSARRSYVDLFLRLIPQYKSTIMNFFDTNAKLRYIVNRNNMIDVSFFAARDHLAISKLMSMKWGNIAGSINWMTRIGDRWRFITTGAITNYSTDMSMDIMDSHSKMTQYIRSFSLNERAIFSISEYHTIEMGLKSELLRIKSGEMYVNNTKMLDIRSGWQNSIWIGYDGELTSRWSLSVGGRMSIYTSMSGDNFHSFIAPNEDAPDFSSKTYINIEPRGNLKYNLDDNHNLKVGTSLTTQDIHGVRSTSTTFPFDRYALSSAFVKPERTLQYNIGYAGMTKTGSWDWSAETYYKSMNNLYDYRDGMSMFTRINLENSILGGKGRSYGLELMLRKNTGKLNGWISYTLSFTDTKIPGINNGQWYKASNDRRNDLSIVTIYNLDSKWKFSASWTYSSGRPITAPDAKYEISGTTCYYYSARNSYKTPASHRLDLSANYTKIGKKFTTIWSFGIYNAYCNYNPFVIYFEDAPEKPSGTKAVQQSLFGLIPSVSYTIKF